MNSFIEELARVAPTFVSAYPNAGLPDPLSETGFPETPDSFAPKVLQWVRNGWLNMVGGCCGTTPAHIAAFAKEAKQLRPRVLPPDARSQSDLGSARVSRAGESVPLSRTFLGKTVSARRVRYPEGNQSFVGSSSSSMTRFSSLPAPPPSRLR
jgi:hypothetical protein